MRKYSEEQAKNLIVKKSKKAKCDNCGETKPKLPHMITLKDKSSVRRGWKDDKGDEWDEDSCPECQKQYDDPPTISKRTCRVCKELLPFSRHFTHVQCQPYDGDEGFLCYKQSFGAQLS